MASTHNGHIIVIPTARIEFDALKNDPCQLFKVLYQCRIWTLPLCDKCVGHVKLRKNRTEKDDINHPLG